MTTTLNWTPAGGINSVSQTIQYRIKNSPDWTLFQDVGPTTNTATITNLEDNVNYEFRVLSMCTYGGPTESLVASAIRFTCPQLSFSNTYNMIAFTWNHPAGHIDRYLVEAVSPTGQVTGTWNYTNMSPVMGGLFTPVDPLTTYRLRITVWSEGASRTCGIVETTTPAAPTCDPPTNIIATLN